MKNERALIAFVGLVLISFMGAGLSAAVEPTIGEITSDPVSPTAQSPVVFSVDLGEETPSEVWITVEECNGDTGVCYKDVQNVSMSPASGLYQASVTLIHADATYITCNVLVKSNGNWSNSSKRIDLSEASNGNTDDNNGNGGKTPGFELVLVLAAIGIALLLGRKRFR